MDGAVGVHRDDGAHLLQDIDQVHDLGLDSGPPQLGQPTGAHGGEQGLLGSADRRIGQLDDGAIEAVGRGQPDALLLLVDGGAELAQDLQVEVDGPVANAAPAQVRDEGLPQAVQERAAEEDRDPGGAGVRVDIGHVRGLDLGGVQLEDTLALIVVDAHTVQAQQSRDHVDVANERDVAQHRGGRSQQGRHHRLGDQILGPADGDLTSQRATALDLEQTVDHAHLHDVIWACRARPGTHPRAGARGRPSISAPEGLPGPFSAPYQVAFDSQKFPINMR